MNSERHPERTRPARGGEADSWTARMGSKGRTGAIMESARLTTGCGPVTAGCGSGYGEQQFGAGLTTTRE